MVSVSKNQGVSEVSFIDPGLIIAFILSRIKKSDLKQIESFHGPHAQNPITKAVRGALELCPLLENQFTLELGSERGLASQGLSSCIRSDLEPYNGLDVICDATSLPFRGKVFDRTWAVYLAHHVANFEALITEACRISEKFYMFDFLPNSWLHYYSKIWDWLIFSTPIKPVNPQELNEISPTHRSYKRSHLGTVLYVFEHD